MLAERVARLQSVAHRSIERRRLVCSRLERAVQAHHPQRALVAPDKLVQLRTDFANTPRARQTISAKPFGNRDDPSRYARPWTRSKPTRCRRFERAGRANGPRPPPQAWTSLKPNCSVAPPHPRTGLCSGARGECWFMTRLRSTR